MGKKISLLLSPNQNTVTLLQTISKVCTGIVIFIGIASLFTYDLHIKVTAIIFPHVLGMNPLISVGFISAAGALSLLRAGEIKNTWRTKLAFILSSVTLLLGIIISTEILLFNLFHINPFIFIILFENTMSFDMGSSFILIGIALFLLPVPTGQHFTRAAQGLGAIVALISMFIVISYLYQAFSFYSLFPSKQMSLSTAITFSFLSIALLFARPSRGFTKVLTRNTPSSLFAFRLIILTLTLPAILGFFLLQGVEAHFYNPQTGVVLLVLVTICILSVAVWIDSSMVQKVELENLIIKTELEKKNYILEYDAKKLASQMLELEEEKHEAYEKLSNIDKIKELPENEI